MHVLIVCHPVLPRKRPRSSSQSSGELDLEPNDWKRYDDYLKLKMDLFRQDITDIRCESDPNVIIKLLYHNARGVIRKLLEPHLADVKEAANSYCQLDLHHLKVTKSTIASAVSIEGLLNQMSVTETWDNTRFLRKAVGAIPHSAPERGIAETILSHYNLYLAHYERATLLKESLASGKKKPTIQQSSGDEDMKLVPLEITIQKPFSDATYEDCHCLLVRVLKRAYGIPEESIRYIGAEERHSTTITYLIPKQYTSVIMQRNTLLDTVWILLELEVIEVAIPEVLLFKPSVDCFLKLLRESRTFNVDLLGVTEVITMCVIIIVDNCACY